MTASVVSLFAAIALVGSVVGLFDLNAVSAFAYLIGDIPFIPTHQTPATEPSFGTKLISAFAFMGLLTAWGVGYWLYKGLFGFEQITLKSLGGGPGFDEESHYEHYQVLCINNQGSYDAKIIRISMEIAYSCDFQNELKVMPMYPLWSDMRNVADHIRKKIDEFSLMPDKFDLKRGTSRTGVAIFRDTLKLGWNDFGTVPIQAQIVIKTFAGNEFRFEWLEGYKQFFNVGELT